MDIRAQFRNFFNSLRNDKSPAPKRDRHSGHDVARTARDSASFIQGPGQTDEIHDRIGKGAANYAKSFKKKR